MGFSANNSLTGRRGAANGERCVGLAESCRGGD